MVKRTGVGLLMVLACLSARSSQGAEPAGKQALLSAAACVTAGQPAVALVFLLQQVPEQLPAAAEAPKRIDLSSFRIDDKKPIPLWEDGASETKAYLLLLGKAWRTSLKAFAADARRDVTYEQVFSEPNPYRGEVVRVEGMLTQLRQRPAPKSLEKEGLATVYQGWLHDPAIEGHKPVAMIFTTLPKGIEPAEDMRHYVSFDGYFFKLLRYDTKEGWTNAPLFIGQGPRPAKPKSFTMTEGQRGLSAAATVFGNPSPAHTASLLHVATLTNAWAKERPKEPPITKAERFDLTPFIIEDKRPVLSWKENPSEATAYVNVLGAAHKTSVEAFAAGANTTVTYAHMFREPQEYRGQVVRIKGTMTRLRRFDPPLLSRADGITDLYEGWLFDARIYGANPICVVFTELPKGLKVEELTRKLVTFDGYFFKKYAYESAERNSKGEVWRAAPLVIGHAPIVEEPPTELVEEGMAIGTGMVMMFLALVAGTMFLALGLVIWYRSGDKHIRNRIANATSARPFVDPSDVPAEDSI